jgi:hypothetical protein
MSAYGAVASVSGIWPVSIAVTLRLKSVSKLMRFVSTAQFLKNLGICLSKSPGLGMLDPESLFCDGERTSPSAAGELDLLREALRGQVPANTVRGVTEAFSIRY